MCEACNDFAQYSSWIAAMHQNDFLVSCQCDIFLLLFLTKTENN